jgi:mono/diheme cytochrome c family protein
VFVALAAPCVGLAQSPAGKTAAATPAAGALPEYHPSMGDLMTMAVQPRHIKLGLAGRQQNWTYAGYELSELRNAFARIARTIPKYQSWDTAEVATAMTQAPFSALEQAIKARDTTQFSAAYAQLTQACNACHQAQNHAAVVVKVPDAAMFPDQDFRPAPR